MAHQHGPAHDIHVPLNPHARRALAGVAGALGLATVVTLIALWPTGEIRSSAAEVGLTSARYRATVTAVSEQACAFGGEDRASQCVAIEVRPSGGSAKDSTVQLPEFSKAAPFAPKLSIGDKIVVIYEPATDTYAYVDRERRPTLLLLTVAFALTVVAVGRLRGIAALMALGGTVAILLNFIVPAVLDGRDPVLVAVAGASAVAFFVLYLANGISTATTAALLGTLGALMVTAVLSIVFFSLSQFTGVRTKRRCTSRWSRARWTCGDCCSEGSSSARSARSTT